MSIKVVLFDLDGTLLPMTQENFIKAYFGTMAKTLAPYGYEPEKLGKGIMAGIAAMTNNDGSVTNEEAFWNVFAGILGEHVRGDLDKFEAYYRNEFQTVKDACGFHEEAAKTVAEIKKKGFRVALATNPLFPGIATESRIRWAGLAPENFEIYTTYENSRFCKPNTQYYLEIVNQLGVKPEECMMVGNDVTEDMVTETLGMKVFLLTDDLINKENVDISRYPHGSFGELMEYIETLAN